MVKPLVFRRRRHYPYSMLARRLGSPWCGLRAFRHDSNKTQPRRCWRAGNYRSPASGESLRDLRVTLAGSPGALTSLVQVFSGLNIRVDQVEYARLPVQPDRACVVVRYWADDRAADLVERKLVRLIEAIALERQTEPNTSKKEV